MLDVMNEQLITKARILLHLIMIVEKEFVVLVRFILMGRRMALKKGTTCQLHMRMFNDGETIYIEPWRSAAMPVIKDLNC